MVPTTSPSATVAPLRIAAEPSWTSVTESPSAVSIVTVMPFFGTVPEKDTVPPAGARTGAPALPPMSTPRCWPAAYGSSPKTNGFRTGPSAGQVHACPVGTITRAAKRAATSARRIGEHLPIVERCCLVGELQRGPGSREDVCRDALPRRSLLRRETVSGNSSHASQRGGPSSIATTTLLRSCHRERL